MSRSIRLFALAAAAATAVALPASAAASSTATPTSIDFGSVPVGTTSGPRLVEISIRCTHYLAGLPPNPGACTTSLADAMTVNPSATGDFTPTLGDCPVTLAPTTTSLVKCTLSVTFHPTAAGARAGTLSTGTLTGAAAGPTVALAGSGLPSPVKKKKCKKHRSAQAAKKKCKKRK